MMCSNCTNYMPPVDPMQGEFWDDGSVNQQRDNALHVHLSGGYGMFVDDWETGPLEVLICHDCAVKLFETFPAFREFAHGGHPKEDKDNPCCEHAW